jgi:NtrC-family two-component system sensor histidine kinase KinB
MRSISLKIALGYFVIIFINTAIAIFAIYYLNRLSSPIDQILEEKLNNVNASRSMIQSLIQMELVQYEIIRNTFDPELQVRFNIYQNEFLNWHQRAIEGVSETMNVSTLDSIMHQFRLYISGVDKLRDLRQDGLSTQNASNYHYNNILPLVRKLESQLSHQIELNREYIARAETEAQSSAESARLIIILFSLVAVIFSIIASIYFTNRIVKPIKHAITTVRKIRKGQLKQKLLISSNDEIAELSREFNNMTERLNEYEQMNIQQIVTEKRKSEAIVRNIPVSIIVTDNEKNIVLINQPAQNLLDISQTKLSGLPVFRVINDKALLKIFTESDTGTDLEFDPLKSVVTITRDDKEVFLLSRQVSITDPDDKITAMVTMLHDITPFKELEHLKSEFIAIISHQFKTPLTSIMMIIDILLKEIKGKINPGQRELLIDAKNDSQRLRDFVFDLLQFSKLETGKIKFEFKKVTSSELHETVQHSIIPLKPMIEEKEVEFTVNISENLNPFQADFQHLSIVFTNIFENALHHLENKGKLSFSAQNAHGFVRFKISDNGQGIAEEKIPFIFDKFVQARYFQNDPHGSIGLGLAIAKEIIMAHGGDIWVKSVRNQGSTFNIEIPLKQDK